MSSASFHAWQVGPVSPLARVAAGALAAVAVDSLFLRQTTTGVVVSVVSLILFPAVAVRIARGLPFASAGAAVLLAPVLAGATWQLGHGQPQPASATAALIVGAVLSALGLGAAIGAHVARHRPIGQQPDIVGQFLHETHDFLRRTPLRD